MTHLHMSLVAAVLTLGTGCSIALTDDGSTSEGTGRARRPITIGAGSPVWTLSPPLGMGPIWSSDGAEVIYATYDSGSTTFIAYAVASRATRVVATTPRLLCLSAPSASLTHLYFIASDGPRSNSCGLYRVSLQGQSQEHLLDSVTFVSASPDNAHLIYSQKNRGQSGYDLWVYDLVQRSRARIGNGFEQSLAYSPDGQQALLRLSSSGWSRVNLADGSSQPLSLGLAADDRASVVTWGTDGIRVFFVRQSGPMNAVTSDYYVQGLGGGNARKFYTEEFDGTRLAVAWSRDGSTLAFAVWNYAYGCAVYAVDVATGKEVWISGAHNSNALLEVSPDGRWILYAFDNWYLSPVAP